jgi:hypothetical protein
VKSVDQLREVIALLQTESRRYPEVVRIDIEGACDLACEMSYVPMMSGVTGVRVQATPDEILAAMQRGKVQIQGVRIEVGA